MLKQIFLWINKQIHTTHKLITGNRLLLGAKTEAPAVEQKSGQLNATDDKSGYKIASGDIQADYARTCVEIQKLREEESQLRMENIELKVRSFVSTVFEDCSYCVSQ